MADNEYKSYDDLPLFISAKTLAEVLDMSISSIYELIHEKGFPSVRIGSRLVVPKADFIKWIDERKG